MMNKPVYSVRTWHSSDYTDDKGYETVSDEHDSEETDLQKVLHDFLDFVNLHSGSIDTIELQLYALCTDEVNGTADSMDCSIVKQN